MLAVLCLTGVPAQARASASAPADAAASKDRADGAASLPAPLEPAPARLPAPALSPITPYRLAELSPAGKRHANLSPEAIAVIYPDIGEPLRSIFTKMIEGMEEQTKVKLRTFALGPNPDMADLNAQLKRAGIKVVISLGRQGLKAVAGIERDIAIVVGGVTSVPEGDNQQLTGISLTPDPALLFSNLKRLLPGAKRVLVIYNPASSDWLIKLARESAKAQGLELQAYEARDIASAARLYESTLAAADPQRDAIWLPQDSTTVEESTILPLVPKESWSRGVPIFSSTFLHVKKGVLFALYPNNLELGRNLADSALGILAGNGGKRGMVPLRNVLTALNVRTANHIGLKIGSQQQLGFDSIFPEP